MFVNGSPFSSQELSFLFITHVGRWILSDLQQKILPCHLSNKRNGATGDEEK